MTRPPRYPRDDRPLWYEVVGAALVAVIWALVLVAVLP